VIVAGAVNAVVVGRIGENDYHLTWDKQGCPVPGCNVSIAPGILTICNGKRDPAEIMWELIDVSAVSSGEGHQHAARRKCVARDGLRD
jgi:hypothetical protein